MPFDWQVQQLRASIFSASPISLTEGHWKQLTGQEEAASRTAVPNGKQYAGQFLGGAFFVGFSGTRADIILNFDMAAADPAQQSLSCIGPFERVVAGFQSSIEGFLSEFAPPISRLAFGAVLMCPAESRLQSYEQLGKLLKSVKVDGEKMREMTFRVNWPRKSAVLPDLELNRLTMWGSQTQVQGLVQVSGEKMLVERLPETFHVTRLDIDHNTHQDWTVPFDAPIRIALFRELIELARDNTVAGER